MTDRETPVVTDEIDALPDNDQAVEAMDAPDMPVIVVPDRADAPVSEITERFLRSIVAQVPLDRIEELHLFSPLRQSGVETGIAVVAARVPVVIADAPAVDATAPELPLADDAAVESVVEVAVDAEVAADDEEIDDVAIDADADAIAAEAIVADEVDADATGVTAEVTEVFADEAADDEDVHVAHVVDTPAPIERHTVYTARYRLVQKGPERGKWESDVVAEADAPLITVETVVRGVQRRAGEESEILRYSARQIAKALHEPWPIVPPPGAMPSPDVQPAPSAA